MPNVRSALESVAGSLKPGAKLLIAEPTGHVNEVEFDRTLAIARGCGLTVIDTPVIWRCRKAALTKSV